ncbi:MAG: sigma-70 family RNA polymerase sigma factor [Thermoanaerobaculia bacterium]|nr:sigma-70 family RNA polymerase sigma factor [Thermoanaerobaculia bacterium]
MPATPVLAIRATGLTLTVDEREVKNAWHSFMPPPDPRGPSTEADLVERFRRDRDRGCFDELYRRSRRRVFGCCLRVVGDLQRAEDLCHDAFVRAYERFDRFEGSAFTTWVCRIGINLSLNEVRHRRVVEQARRQVAPPPPRPCTAEARLLSREALSRASDIIEGLEPRQRKAFLLRHVDELSYDEIGQRTGWTTGQVRSYLQNARRNFRLAWRARCPDPQDD